MFDIQTILIRYDINPLDMRSNITAISRFFPRTIHIHPRTSYTVVDILQPQFQPLILPRVASLHHIFNPTTTQVRSSYGASLESLHAGSTVGLLLDDDCRLHLYIDGLDQGVAASDLPSYVYAVLDLYGQCEQVSIAGPPLENASAVHNAIPPSTNENDTNNATASAIMMAERLSIEAEDAENSREKADLECHEKESGSGALLVDELVDGSGAGMAVGAEGQEDEEEEEPGGGEACAEMDVGDGAEEMDNDVASRHSAPSNRGEWDGVSL